MFFTVLVYFSVFSLCLISAILHNFAEKMKKILIILILFTAHIAVLPSTVGVQDDVQNVPMQIRKPITSGGVGKPKRSPLHIPDVLYANNSLYFDDSQIGCMFEIYDGSENVILIDYVPSNAVYMLPNDINCSQKQKEHNGFSKQICTLATLDIPLNDYLLMEFEKRMAICGCEHLK